MEWIELQLPAGGLAEEVAALLTSTDEIAARGVEVRGDDVILWVPLAERDAGAAALRAAAIRLRDAGLPIDPDAIRVVPARPEDEWRDAWKRYFHVKRVTRRIVIVPSWESYEPRSDDVVLDLDPGRAFGTGAHASTRLCLVELERLHDDDRVEARRVLDVGTGSGILAIAAAKLWPGARVLALDLDPDAVSAAQENVERNAVVDRVRTSDHDVAHAGGGWDVVVVNIQADVLDVLRPALVGALAAGGALVLAGLLADQAEPVARGYEAAGLTRVRVTTLPDEPDWSAVVLRTPTAPGRATGGG